MQYPGYRRFQPIGIFVDHRSKPNKRPPPLQKKKAHPRCTLTNLASPNWNSKGRVDRSFGHVLTIKARRLGVRPRQFLIENPRFLRFMKLTFFSIQSVGQFKDEIYRSILQIQAVTIADDNANRRLITRKRNRSIIDTFPDPLGSTRFTREQLRSLLIHLRLPELAKPKGRKFSGESILLISLTRFAHGFTWNHMAQHVFGGNPDFLMYAYEWFVDHLYVNFYHKIN